MHGIDSVKAVLQGKMIKLNVLKINLKLNSNVAELNESTLKLKQLLWLKNCFDKSVQRFVFTDQEDVSIVFFVDQMAQL